MEVAIWIASILLPLVVGFFLLLFYRKEILWWELLVLFLISVIGASSVFIFKSSNTSDVEYQSERILRVNYYEDWNEYIHKTCSYTTCSGGKVKTCTTHYYDCSYVQYHPERWTMQTGKGKEYEISKKHYNVLKERFRTAAVFVELNRRYHTNDGNQYYTAWDGIVDHSKTVVEIENYENRTQSAYSIFKFEVIDEKEKAKFDLFDYPVIDEHREQKTVLGINLHPVLERRLQYINGYFGPKSQFKMFFLVYKNQPLKAFKKQKSYWQGANKNEMVIGIGLDESGKVIWKDSFSWCKDKSLETSITSAIDIGKKPNWFRLYDQLSIRTENEWHRREFKEFDYLSIEITKNQMIWVLIIILIINALTSIWIVKNNFNSHNY